MSKPTKEVKLLPLGATEWSQWEQRRGKEWTDFEPRLNGVAAKADNEKGRRWEEGTGPDQTNAEIQIWSLDFSILSVFVVKTSWLGFLLFVTEEI